MTAEGANDSAAAAEEPAVRLQTIACSLAAWELQKNLAARADTPRQREFLLHAHQQLQAELEERRQVPPADRSVILQTPGARESVLLIHGATTTPAEMRPLAQRLQAAGYHVYAPLLPTRANLAPGLGDVLWRACLEEVLVRYRLLKQASRRVHVVGLSFGAALAIHLARQERPASLALLAPALIPRLPVGVRLLLRLGVQRMKWVRRRYGWSLEVLQAMERARPCVSRLGMPVYAAQCQDDERMLPASLRFLQRKTRHRNSRFRLYPTGGHLILRSHGPTGLHDEIAAFIREA